MAGEAFVIKGMVGLDTGPLRSGIHEASGLVTGFGGSVVSAGAAVASALGTAVVAAGAAAGAGLGVAVKEAANFEKVMSGVKAVSGSSAQEMKTLSTLALKLGADTSFSATEAGQGIEELVKAGVSVADIMGGAAKASLDLAAAGGIKVADAATIASQAMNTFGIKGAAMGHVADVIAGAANASAIDVGQFKFSLQAAGSVAATVGVSFDDLATSIAVMGQNGIVGSDAGTSLKTMLMNLQPATDKQKQLFKDLGLTTADGANKFFDASGKIKSMSEVSGVLADATKNMTQQQKLATFEVLFGSDAIRAAAVFAKTGAAGFTDMATAMGKVSAADVANTRLDNLAGSMEKLKGSLSTLAITVGLTLTPSIRKLVDLATESVNAWQPVITAYAEKIPGAIEMAVTRITAFVPRVKAAFVDAGQVVGAFVGLDLDSYAAGWDTWAGIAVRSFDLFKGAVRDVWDTVQSAVPVIVDTFNSLAPVAFTVGKAFVDNIVGTFQWIVNDIMPPVISIVKQTADFFLTTLQPAMQETTKTVRGVFGASLSWLATDVWPSLMSIAEQAASFWTTTLLPAFAAAAGPIRTVVGESIKWVADVAWPAFLSAAGGVVDFLKTNVVPLLPDIARNVRDVLGGAIKWVGETGWPLFVTAATTAYQFVNDKVIPVIRDLAGWLMEKLPPAIDGIMTAWTAVSERVGPIIQAIFSGDIKTAISKAGDAFSEFASLAVGWIGEQVGRIDWREVWDYAKDVTIKMANWFVDVGSQVVGWIGEQIAKVDWLEVWNYAKDVTIKMADWFVDVATQFGTWIGEQVAKIDWPAVWINVQDMASAMQTSFTEQAAKIDWKGVLAGAVNAAADMFQWLTDTITSIDWANVGVKTAELLTGMFVDAEGKTDWATVGGAFVKGIGAMLGTAVAAGDAWAAFKTGFQDGITKAISESSFGDALRAMREKIAAMFGEAWSGAIGAFTPGGNTGMRGSEASAGSAVRAGTGSASAVNAGPIDNSSRTSFVKTAWPYMLAAAGGDKDLAELMLAKAISENGTVGSGGAFLGNNFSGIKGVGDAGSFRAMTWEQINGKRVNMEQDFAAYSTPQKGFEAFMQFLKDNSRYKPALEKYNSGGGASQLIKDINSAGYATDTNWWMAIENIRKNQVAPFTKDLREMTGAFDRSTEAMKDNTTATGEASTTYNTATKAADSTAEAVKEASQANGEASTSSQNATKSLFDLGVKFNYTAKAASDTAASVGDSVGKGLPRTFDLMSTSSLKSIEQLSTGFKTQISDASGNVITTTTNMSGKMIDQTATLANGVKVNMADLAKGTVTNVEQMATGVKTTMTDASGNIITTVTDLAGQVVSQTAEMADGGKANAQRLGTEVKAAITDMAGGTLTVTRDMAGNLVSTIRDASGGVVQQYRSMATDVAGQAADLARASAMTNGQISSGTQTTMSTVRNAAREGAAGYDQFGNSVTNAGRAVQGFSQDAKWLADHGFVVPGFTQDARWLAEHGMQPPRQGRATGGSTLANASYWVGELNKPELFTPSVPGQINTLDQVMRARAESMASAGPLERHLVDIEVSELLAAQIYVTGRQVTIKRGEAE